MTPTPRERSAVISGSFADYRLVKSRSVLQVIVEIPIEQQGAAFAALGYPLPGTEIPVAVARLNPRAGAEPESTQPLPQSSGQARLEGRTVGSIPTTGAKERYAAMTPAEQAVTRAAMLAQDFRFRMWITERELPRSAYGGFYANEQEAADLIRSLCCDGNSRKLIAERPEYLDRFLAMETQFKMDVGEMARPR